MGARPANFGGGIAVKLQLMRAGFERLLEWIVIVLMLALTLLVCVGAFFRYIGSALSWYDELASIGLVWLTYYGSALAAFKGAHIGVAGFVNLMPHKLRVGVTVFAEACVFLFFALLAWTGLQVLEVLGGDTMVSLDWVPLRLTESAIPAGAVLFIVAEALRFPKTLADARASGFVDVEITEALEEVGAELPSPALPITGERT